MIVQCTACQAKFRIADEKVTPKGVKVRCSQCKNTFTVRKEESNPPLEPTRPGISIAATQLMGRPRDDGDVPTKVGVYAAGVEATRTEPPTTRGPSPTGTRALAATLPDFRVSGSRDTGPTRADPFDSALIAAGDHARTEPGAPVGVVRPAEPEFRLSAPLGSQPSAGPDPFAVPGLDPFGGPATANSPNDAVTEPPAFHVSQPVASAPVGDGLDDAFKDLPSSPEMAAPADSSFVLPDIPASTSDDAFDRSAFDMGLVQPADGGVSPEPIPDVMSQPRAQLAPSTRMRSEVISLSGLPPPDAPLPRDRKRAKRTPLASAANAFLLVLAAAVAVVSVAVYANEGRFEAAALNPVAFATRLRGVNTKEKLVASDVTNGLYETVTGRNLFYVRGVVTRFSGPETGTVRVVVEIANRDGTVRKAKGLAGSSPTPDQLFHVSQADDLVALEKELAKKAPRVAVGGSAPFAVAFYDYPDDFSEARLRVSLEPAEDQVTTTGG
jgi:predicted Zn finger-like uncharacterized protein